MDTRQSLNIRYLRIALGVGVGLAIAWYFRTIVSYLIIAWVLSLIGQSFMIRFMKLKIKNKYVPQGIAAILTIIAMLGILIGFFLLFVPLIVSQAHALASVDYTSLIKTLEPPLHSAEDWLHQRGLLVADQSLVDAGIQAIKDWFKPAWVNNTINSLFSALGNFVVGFASVFFILFFMLKERSMVKEFVAVLVPKQYEAKILHAFQDISFLLRKYFTGLIIQLLVNTTCLTIILLLIGIPNAFLMALLWGFLNMIPYVGPLIGYCLLVMLTITSNLGMDWSQLKILLFKVTLANFGQQQIDGFLIAPYVHSKSAKAHPLEIFLVILAGARMGGILGMVIAIPTYTVLRVIARVFFNEFRLVQHLTDSIDNPRAD